MYCMHCGKQIPDNARFCPGCGGRTEEVYSISNNNNNVNDSEIRFNHSSGKLAGSIVIIFLCIAFQVFLFCMIFNDDIWKHYTKDARTVWTSMYIVLIINFFILIIVNFVKINAVGKTLLCLTKDNFYGTGGTPHYYGNIGFNCKYDEVLSITTNGSAVIICTIGGNIKLLLDEKNKAIHELYQRVEKAKKESGAWQNNRM